MGAPSIDQPETVEVETLNVSCDGGGGALGHPLVYLTINTDKSRHVECPYCDKRFVLKEGAKVSGHH